MNAMDNRRGVKLIHTKFPGTSVFSFAGGDVRTHNSPISWSNLPTKRLAPRRQVLFFNSEIRINDGC